MALICRHAVAMRECPLPHPQDRHVLVTPEREEFLIEAVEAAHRGDKSPWYAIGALEQALGIARWEVTPHA